MALTSSGVAGGLTMGLTALSTGLVIWLLRNGTVSHLVAATVYPIGFVAVVIGRAPLFTENTLPCCSALGEKRHFLKTLTLWAAVFGGNWLGSLAFAALVSKTSALQPAVRNILVGLGISAVDHPLATVFWTAVGAGWPLALVAWLVTASHWTTGQALMTWTMTFVLGMGKFARCGTNSGEILSALISGRLGLRDYGSWLAAATGQYRGRCRHGESFELRPGKTGRIPSR
jgi:formate/nitrite transporter FocA (FNT family)